MTGLLEKIKYLRLARHLKRTAQKVDWHRLRSTTPVSEVFGFDRGTPVDRYYIENFLRENGRYIANDVLEISENTYSKKFAKENSTLHVLHVDSSNPHATLVGDLTDTTTLPANFADCFICTQTLNFIYDVHRAVAGIHHLLKKNGSALITVAGISQISRYDMDRWGDYWRFTTKSIQRIFEEVFGKEHVNVVSYGNVLSAVAFLEGISSEELTVDELNFTDANYQVLIAVRAVKQ